MDPSAQTVASCLSLQTQYDLQSAPGNPAFPSHGMHKKKRKEILIYQAQGNKNQNF